MLRRTKASKARQKVVTSTGTNPVVAATMLERQRALVPRREDRRRQQDKIADGEFRFLPWGRCCGAWYVTVVTAPGPVPRNLHGQCAGPGPPMLNRRVC